MRAKTLSLFFVCFTSLGCSDPPAPAPPVDVVIVYDIVAIDRPGDRPPIFEDRPPSDVNTDRGPERCLMSSFVPCECAPGATGLRRCLPNGMLETVCRCEGFDAGPEDVTGNDTSAQDAVHGDAPGDAPGDLSQDTPGDTLDVDE